MCSGNQLGGLFQGLTVIDGGILSSFSFNKNGRFLVARANVYGSIYSKVLKIP